ncbi:MAG: LytTR family DNA-binding domain-containing protein [Litorimonas sp.]
MKSPLTQTYVLKGLFVLILGVALGVGGPYGTFESLSIAPRVGFWVLALLLPWGLWEALFAIASKYMPAELSPRLLMALIMPVFAVVGSAFVTAFGIQIGFLKAGTFLHEWPLSIVKWLVFSFIVVLPLILIGDELFRRQHKSGGSDLLNFLTEKLPPKLRGAELIALKSEDHYLRVYTSAGDDLILMSMENAVIALSGYPGVRTHRSWWVALNQLPRPDPEKKLATEVQLTSGLIVPISRRRAKLVNSTYKNNK